jgi:RNA polymerase sigma-70 factor, ECF subfamily
VDAVRGGEADAYRELFQRHRGRVAKIVASYVADRETRLDLVQDVFVRAIERLHQLQEPERFAPWLSQIARRVSIDFLRSQKTSVSHADGFDQIAATDPSPSDAARASELAHSVQMCFAVLSPRDATVLTLVVQLGFTSSDLSEALGVTQNNAKVILHRARHRLRNAVEIAESTTAGTAV